MLYTILQASAERTPDKVAIRYGTKAYRYRELLEAADAMAAALQMLELGTGDRLAFYLYNCPEVVISYFACFKLGITAVPINYRLKSDEVHYIIEHSRPKLIISEHALFSNVEGGQRALQSIEYYFLTDAAMPEKEVRPFSHLLRMNSGGFFPIEVPGSTVAAVLYTSGTTGKPKGAELAHDQMMAHTYGHCDLVSYTAQDNTLVCLALSNNFAFSHQMLSALHAGATLVITAAFDPEEVLEKIEREAITMLYMMPVMYHALNKVAARGCRISNTLRLAVVAGDTTPYVTMKQFEKLFGLQMCEGIGMTETQVYALNPLGAGKKKGSVGRPVPYTEVSVQDDDGNRLNADEIGEIAVRGEIIMRRYLDNPEVTAESFRNGWFLTGDMGYFDEEGYLWFRGRRKQLIVHDGSNISPQEVEEVFYHHPSVFEVGVIGIPDKYEGELLHAFVALKSGAAPVSEAELLGFAREHLAEYKLPGGITFIETLPKGATGKIDRKELQTYPRR